MIWHAGTDKEWQAGLAVPADWFVVDMGFAQASNPSCGAMDGLHSSPTNATFSGLCQTLSTKLSVVGNPLHLVLEAPLSRAFDQGCPVARTIERQNGQTRGWHSGTGGALTMLAAGHLLRQVAIGGVVPGIAFQRPRRDVILFEGFVSFKPKTPKGNASKPISHRRDVLALALAIKSGPPQQPQASSGTLASLSPLFALPQFKAPWIFEVSQTQVQQANAQLRSVA